MEKTSRDTCLDVFKNIHDDTSKYSYEVPPQKGESDEKDHVCLKSYKENDIGLTYVNHNQMFNISANIVEKN